MDDNATRAIVIGVNVFVTITIVTIVMFMFFQMQEIYGVVAKTDNSIYSTFDNVHAMYSGRTMSGLGLLNTIKKYENQTYKEIVIQYPGSDRVQQYTADSGLREATFLKDIMQGSGEYLGNNYSFEKQYLVQVEEISDEQVKIVFNEK